MGRPIWGTCGSGSTPDQCTLLWNKESLNCGFFRFTRKINKGKLIWRLRKAIQTLIEVVGQKVL